MVAGLSCFFSPLIAKQLKSPVLSGGAFFYLFSLYNSIHPSIFSSSQDPLPSFQSLNPPPQNRTVAKKAALGRAQLNLLPPGKAYWPHLTKKGAYFQAPVILSCFRALFN